MRSKSGGLTVKCGWARVGLLGIVCVSLPAADYRLALPGYRYEFPRDHFNHRDFETEWWYYTGNLFTAEGRRFGFELTFFRQAVARTGDTSTWSLEDLYLAHFAVSDIENEKFHYTERMNRPGPGLAGASLEQGRVWNGNWEVCWEQGKQRLRAVTGQYTIELTLTPRKKPVIHGRNGVSQKAAGDGRASHHVSLTRLEAEGQITINGTAYEVRGSAWMDHEFFTQMLAEGQAGWDWLSIQLEDGSELMLYQLRRSDGSVDPYSPGTYVAPYGETVHLSSKNFSLSPGERRLRSYPIEWTIRVEPIDLELHATTPLENQELISERGFVPRYWEGAMDYEGTKAGRPIRGTGYLEMTGYEEPVKLGQESVR